MQNGIFDPFGNLLFALEISQGFAVAVEFVGYKAVVEISACLDVVALDAFEREDSIQHFKLFSSYFAPFVICRHMQVY